MHTINFTVPRAMIDGRRLLKRRDDALQHGRHAPTVHVRDRAF
jgi:hypothetical protein